MKIDRIPYLVDMGVGLLFAAITVALNLDQGYQPWRQVCDALFVAATVLLGVGGLQFCRNHGAFDTMGYGMKQLANTIAPWAISPDSNLGKKESFLEYKERKEYVVETSVLKHEGPVFEEYKPVTARDVEHTPQTLAATPILFATPTCPNCRIAASYMDKAGFKYEKLMADENAELAKSYGVKQAPTLVVDSGEEFIKVKGVSDIKKFLNEAGKSAV